MGKKAKRISSPLHPLIRYSRHRRQNKLGIGSVKFRRAEHQHLAFQQPVALNLLQCSGHICNIPELR